MSFFKRKPKVSSNSFYSNTLNGLYYDVHKYLELLTLKDSKNTSLVILGRGGLGKTHNIINHLSKLGVEYVYLNNYTTSLGLYNYLSEHKDSLIVLDDVDSLVNNRTAISTLKSCLWPNNLLGERWVNYTSTSKSVKDKKFLFSGKMIILLNEFPKSVSLRALRDRSLFVEFDLNNNDLFKIYQEFDKSGKESLTPFIKKYGKDNYNLTLRSYFKLHDLKNHFPKEWERLGVKLLVEEGKNLRIQWIVRRLTKSELSVKDQIARFKSITSMDRATYFRYKNKLKSRKKSQF